MPELRLDPRQMWRALRPHLLLDGFNVERDAIVDFLDAWANGEAGPVERCLRCDQGVPYAGCSCPKKRPESGRCSFPGCSLEFMHEGQCNINAPQGGPADA